LYNFKKQYDPDYPIIVGLAGKAATGKTVVAETIVPKASFGTNSNGLVWDHIFFAMPLYEFYSIRTKIEGMNAQSRKLFATHETLYDLYGSSPLGNVPDYKNFVDLVNQINSEPVDHDGSKPRSFLQKIGDYCRSYDEECFAKWGVRKANQIHSDYTSSLSEESELPHCVLISDVRFVNEAQAILSQPNGIIIKFEASDQVRRERILSRDFVLMTDEQLSHRSEKEIDSMSDIIDLVINSDSMSIEDQVNETIKLIKESFGV
jgi:cytidylate kinase